MPGQMRGPEMGCKSDLNVYTDLLPFWLTNPSDFHFAEGEGEGDGGEGQGSGTDEGDDDEGNDEGDDKPPAKPEDSSGLKSALEKERRERKKLEREARELRKFKEQEENKNKSEVERAKDEASKAAAKAARLAEGFRRNAVDLEITKLAGSLKFRDVDDALRLIDRGDIEVEQDEDDPSSVKVDADSVKRALEALAAKKKHLIATDEADDQDDDDAPTGGNVGTGKKRSSGVAKEDQLRELYPALQRR